MTEEQERRLNIYGRRLQMEMTVPEEAIQRRMRWDMPVLSSNHKCSISLDLPVLNCRPTKVCAEVCYASQGRQAYRKAVVKSQKSHWQQFITVNERRLGRLVSPIISGDRARGYLSIVGFTPRKVEVRLSNLMAFEATAQGNWGCLPEHYPGAL